MPLQDDRASQIEVPQDVYKLRVMEAERGVSKLKEDGSGNNPMITLVLEVTDAAPVNVKDHETGETTQVNINGLQVRSWVTLTPKALGAVNTIKKALAMEPVTADYLLHEDSNLYLGKVGYAILKGNNRNILKADGTPSINPHTNKPVTVPELRLVKWLTP